ncbi:MAG: conjugal transfer protein TraN [Pseudomonadota bacterium]
MLLFIVFKSAAASDQRSYNAGKSFAQSEAGTADHSQLAPLAGAAGNCAQQRYFNDSAAMENDASSLFIGGNENSSDMAKQVSGSLQEAANQRPMYLFDEKNEFIQAGDYIVTHALDKIKAKESLRRTTKSVKTTVHECEEARGPTYYACTQTRQIRIDVPRTQIHRVSVPVYSHGWSGGLSRNVITGQKYDSSNPNNPGHYAASTSISSPLPEELRDRVESLKLVSGSASLSQNGTLSVSTSNGYSWLWLNFTAQIDITYRTILKDEDIHERIGDRCRSLEKQADKGLCEYVDEQILEGPETREINGHPIIRDWWKKKRTYKCSFPSKNTCGDLRRRGCRQIDSRCKTKLQGTCVEYTQTFECEHVLETVQGSSLTGPVPFCLDSNCDEHAWAPNQDFAEAISKLAILKEMSKGMTKHPITIFTGQVRSCRKDCLSFRDCCGTGKGWGKTFGYTCKAEERQLAQLRGQRKCVFVGTFCAKKKLGICLRKRSSFCCFGSKLVRIVQEQGRGQLGMGWGDPKYPNCRGLTVAEISRVDFSKLDLREVFEDIMHKTNKPDFKKFTTELQHNAGAKIKGMAKRFHPEQVATKQLPPRSLTPGQTKSGRKNVTGVSNAVVM